MIQKPTVIVHTLFFPVNDAANVELNPERAAAARLGEDLYKLLTRPLEDALVWGPGIPVHVASRWQNVDAAEAKHVVVIPVLGQESFAKVRQVALDAMKRLVANGVRLFPVLASKSWRTVEAQIPKPVLTELYGATDPRRTTLNEILLCLARVLSGDDKYASQLFISHAKADLDGTGKAAEQIGAYVLSETTGKTFFDKVSILPGEELTPQIDRQVERGVFIAVRGDKYSSRTWCRHELLRAKQARVPTLVVEVLSAGEVRSAAYGGNGPTVVWDRAAANGSSAVGVVLQAMVEVVRHLFFLAESTRVIAAAGLPGSTERLSRPPELLDLAPLRSRTDASLVVLHSDPPLPTFERVLLQEAEKRLRLVTPTTAFACGIGSSIRTPLDGWQIALSISDVLGSKSRGGAEGIAGEHLNDATVFLARALVGMGAAIAYGGDFRDRGFTPLLVRLILDYNETGRREPDFLHAYIGATVSVPADDNLAYTAHSMRSSPLAVLASPEGDVTSHRAALHFSDMRRAMAIETHARVILGGTAEPKSSKNPKGYSGRFPGVVEEAWRTLEKEKPLYVAGGYGGAAELVAKALEQAEPPPLLQDSMWESNDDFTSLATAFDADPDAAKLELPKSQRELARRIREFGERHLASNDAALKWNGLTLEENRLLFRTRDPLTLTTLVAKGLVAVSTRRAEGRLRVELVEGDVSSASQLEVLIFASFDGLALDGAGAALDRLSGGAATRAHEARTVVPSGSNSLDAEFVYAASLGEVSEALKDIRRAVAKAITATAEMLRRSRFSRAGIVTFLGNVAPNLGEVVEEMVSGLRSAADTTEFVWFERDPVRAAIIAVALDAHPNSELTRRATPLPVAPPVPGKRRTMIAVRHAKEELDVALLLHQANGLAPVVQTKLLAAARDALAGRASDAVPDPKVLAQRGALIAELLFGAAASRVLGDIAASELVILHDDSAGGIPYEALCWTANGNEVTPATSGGIVRHLLAPGIGAERALTRPARPGKIGVLVVINPLGDLPGAEEEGNALLRALGQGPFHVVTLRGQDATVEAVRKWIADPTIDVLHYCGHAFFKGKGPDNSGLNCSDGALTLERIRDLHSVPRLAFVNACQAGRVREKVGEEREPEAFAELFLRAGVDAYLGAFWLVSDKGAALFAASVYAELTKGIDLGTAVLEGRKRLKEAGNRDWANYVLYGDATFRLVRGESGADLTFDSGELFGSSFRVDGNVIVASWVFGKSEAPPSFEVVAVDSDTGAPVELAAPMRVERREAWAGATLAATWIVTLVTRVALAGPVQLRPSSGEAIDVQLPPDGEKTRAVRAPDTTPSGQLAQLRTFLDQQPDGGRAILMALIPSASPDDLRAELNRAALAPEHRAIWPLSEIFSKDVDDGALVAFANAYGIPTIDVKEAATEKFQTKEDWAAYAFTPGAIGFVTGGDVLEPMWHKLPDPEAAMTHSVRPGEFNGSIEFALFSDNGNGTHPGLSIAKQVVDSKLPYAFHLGDVYYGGSKQEFADFFETPLRPMLDRTELFMITGNHEMYARGEWFQDLIRRKAAAHPTRQRQCGEMFRLQGPGFQVIGVDTMFVGWNAKRLRLHDYADAKVLKVLDSWLGDQTPGDLTILATTNEPWDLGSRGVTKLYDSVRTTIAGRVDFWFWGNVHHGSLYEPWPFADTGSPRRGLVGSCIGHGGYPFYTQKATNKDVLPEGVRCRWLETRSRFWPDDRIRKDVGANGWCRMKLERAADRWDVRLTYVDWVGRDRLRATLSKADGAGICFEHVEESDQTAVGEPLQWKPK
jgi:hypothetical protein